MAAKIFFTICVHVFIIQTITCQSVSNAFNPTNINPSLIDSSLSAIDISFGPNEMAFNPIAANEVANGPRIATNEITTSPRVAANEMAYGPRIAANEMAYGPRIVANEMAYGPRIVANEMAYGPRIAPNEIGYGPRIAPNGMAYGPRISGNEMAANGLALDRIPLAGYGSLVPSSGGSFPVTSSSRIAPTGITIISENTIEGLVAVNGQLPLVAAVSLQGSLPTTGSGSIAYGCGNGAVGIVNDGVGSAAAELAYGQRLANEIDLARLGRV